LSEGREFAELREFALQFSADLLGGLDLRGGSHARHGKTDGNRGADTLVEQVGLKEDLSVGDGDDVGRDVGRDVAGEGLDDRERRE